MTGHKKSPVVPGALRILHKSTITVFLCLLVFVLAV